MDIFLFIRCLIWDFIRSCLFLSLWVALGLLDCFYNIEILLFLYQQMLFRGLVHLFIRFIFIHNFISLLAMLYLYNRVLRFISYRLSIILIFFVLLISYSKLTRGASSKLQPAAGFKAHELFGLSSKAKSSFSSSLLRLEMF